MTCPIWMSAARLMLPMVTLLALAPATAAPVVTGSSYSLYMNSAPGVTVIPEVSFDGVDQTFTRTVTLADGQQAQVGFSVHEEQIALGNDDWSIRIVIDAEADLYPTGALAGFGFGVEPDNPLDLDGDWRLLSSVVTLYAGAVELASGDWLSAVQDFGQPDPWDGFFISDSFFGAFQNLNGQGVDRIEFDVRVSQAVPEPGSLALVALGFVACVAVPRRIRRRPWSHQGDIKRR